jgi:hypothetical protein
MIPQIALTARYTRLSPITPPVFNLGSSASSSPPFCVDTNGGIMLGSRNAGGAVTCPAGSRTHPLGRAVDAERGLLVPGDPRQHRCSTRR